MAPHKEPYILKNCVKTPRANITLIAVNLILISQESAKKIIF